MTQVDSYSLEQEEIKRNKAVRGFIVRSLVKGYNYTAITRQIAGALWSAGLVLSPDISKHIDYLVDAGYVEITGDKVKAFRAYQDDAILKLTKEGVDLAEGTTEDPGLIFNGKTAEQETDNQQD